MQPIRHWLTNRFVSHLDGVTVRNDRIIVPETGLYFVYSQAAFLIYYDPDKALTDHNQSIFHHVYRFNKVLPNNGVQELMRSDTSQCWEQNKQYSRYTSYVGAAIKLRKDDELFVKVSNVAALKIEPSLTYFGMFKL